tara:strand:+ start:640 stop:1239 length:600 start_codon:yes stop_codon:yes gene_type:complete
VNNLNKLKGHLKLNKKKKLLEVGCNQGLVTQNLLKIKNLEITSIDTNKHWLNVAKKKLHKNKRISFKNKDFLKIKNEKKFDIIIFREFFNIFTYKKNIQILKKAEKILKKNGIIILIDFYKSVVLRSKIIKFFFRSKELTKNENKFLKSRDDYKKYFCDEKWNVIILNKDLLNQHISLKSKILEIIFPVKYTIIANKKK